MEASYKLAKYDICQNLYQQARKLITGVFFMWGLSYGLLEVLNKHFQEILHISKAQSGLLQTAYFGAYFLAAFPAAIFIQRAGYKNGILLGLVLYAIGALLFIPASVVAEFSFFLGALFILACGLACLETAANPYMAQLGDKKDATRRLNLAQSFCGLGCFIGPLLGGILFFNSKTAIGENAPVPFVSLQFVYLGLAIVVLLISVLIAYSAMPEIHESIPSNGKIPPSLLSDRIFVGGVITQFFYVSAQVGSGAFFINYVTENLQTATSQQGAFLLSLALLLFTLGRFVSTWLMGKIAPSRLLSCYSLFCVAACLVIYIGQGMASIVALVSIFFFTSLMFPTIFALAIRNLGASTKKGASILMMAMLGGALTPPVMGYIADNSAVRNSYIVPLICFVVVFIYGRFFRHS